MELMTFAEVNKLLYLSKLLVVISMGWVLSLSDSNGMLLLVTSHTNPIILCYFDVTHTNFCNIQHEKLQLQPIKFD